MFLDTVGSSAFDLTRPDAEFSPDNFRDPICLKIRELAQMDELKDVTVGKVILSTFWFEDHYIIALRDLYFGRLFHMIVYKHRGRTELFYDCLTGKPVTTEDIHDLFISLDV